MTRHRLNVFITLIIILLIIAGFFAWATGGFSGNKPEESVSPSITPETGAPEVTIAPEATAAPPEATIAPEESPEPDNTPHTRTLNTEGSFETTTGTNLNMVLRWHAVSKNDETVTLTATAYIYSYTIKYGTETGSMSINGVSKSFVTDPLSYESTDRLQEVELYTMSLDLPVAVGETVSVPVSAVWNFRGEYNGQPLDGISINEYVLIEG